MEKIFAIIGIILCLGVTYALSTNKKDINWKSVGCAFFGQFIIALLLLKTPLWKGVQLVGNGVSWLLEQANEGIQFVFGGLTTEYVFFLNALLPIVFISGLMGLLYHFGIIQKFVGIVGKFVAKVLGVDVIVGINGITNMFMGQSDSLFITKAYLPSASESVIFATLVGGMTSISVSVLGLYTSYGANMNYLIVSLPLSVCSTFALTQILMPTKYTPVEELQLDDSDRGANAIETMMNYSTSGFKAVVAIAVALMMFLSLIAMIDGLLGLINVNLSLQTILGYLFYPLAFVMGVPQAEVMDVAQILATKFITNEAVAYGLPQFATLSAKANAMMTVGLAGFGNLSSIGILLGGYAAVAPKQVPTVAKLGMKALLTATVVTMVSGAIIGLFI